LREIDARVGTMLGRLGDGDLLIVTADHGVDLAHLGTDHTREYAPLLAVTGEMLARRGEAARPGELARRGEGGTLGGARHDGALADVGATILRWLTGRDAPGLPGDAFLGRGVESRGAT
jgi:phosphopentomutase